MTRLEAQSRNELIAFVQRVFPPYRVAPHHRLVAEHLEAVERGDIDRLVITMPPRHGKSELASVHFPAWFLGRNPDCRIIAASYASTLAYRFSRRARNLMAHPLWPFDVTTAGDLANVQQWDIEGHRGGYYAAGVGGGIAGHGADVLLIDDPVKSAEEADSETYRESTWEWFTQDAVTRLEPAGRIVLIGTRWHEDDLIGRVLASGERWHHIDLPALSEDGAALWPERFNTEALTRIKTQIGSRAFEALYQQRPSTPEGGTFKRHWWKSYRELPKLTRVEQFLDSAFKTGVGNDFSVIATWGDDGQGNLYVIDVWRDKVEYPDLMQIAQRQHARHAHLAPSVPLVIEDKASGQSAIQTLSRPLPLEDGTTLPRLPVVPFPIPAGASKESRAEGVSPMVEAGRVFLPQGAEWAGDFIEEHATFPTGAHDDQVDTTSMAIARLARTRGATMRAL